MSHPRSAITAMPFPTYELATSRHSRLRRKRRVRPARSSVRSWRLFRPRPSSILLPRRPACPAAERHSAGPPRLLPIRFEGRFDVSSRMIIARPRRLDERRSTPPTPLDGRSGETVHARANGPAGPPPVGGAVFPWMKAESARLEVCGTRFSARIWPARCCECCPVGTMRL